MRNKRFDREQSFRAAAEDWDGSEPFFIKIWDNRETIACLCGFLMVCYGLSWPFPWLFPWLGVITGIGIGVVYLLNFITRFNFSFLSYDKKAERRRYLEKADKARMTNKEEKQQWLPKNHDMESLSLPKQKRQRLPKSYSDKEESH